MIIFDQLRISDDGKRMYINLHVNSADYFDDVYLKSITIVTADTVLEAYGDGIDPMTVSSDYIYHYDFDSNLKEAAFVLNSGSFDAAFTGVGTTATASKAFSGTTLSNTLFCVYVECELADGTTMDSCTPCTLDETLTLGVVFDDNVLYQRVMNYTKELIDNCGNPSKAFIDFILLWNAFKASVETEHFIDAVTFYNMLFGKADVNTPYGSASSINLFNRTKPCGCHG